MVGASKGGLATSRAFHRPPILAAVAELRHQPEATTRNRKRLRAGEDIPPEYPDPTWEIRVGAHRVLYAVEIGTVRILGVRLKGQSSTGEIL
jgi:hypothetical protein